MNYTLNKFSGILQKYEKESKPKYITKKNIKNVTYFHDFSLFLYRK